jgi:hypothetical protein
LSAAIQTSITEMLNLAPEPTEGDYSGGEDGIHESNKTPVGHYYPGRNVIIKPQG